VSVCRHDGGRIGKQVRRLYREYVESVKGREGGLVMGRYAFSQRSFRNLDGVHPDLVRVVQSAMDMQVLDFAVDEGVRTVVRQAELLKDGRTRTMESKHLIQPDGFGHAVDLSPYPLDWEAVTNGDYREIARFGVLAGVMLMVAKLEGVVVVNGMDWDGDGLTLDHTLFDGPHFHVVLF